MKDKIITMVTLPGGTIQGLGESGCLYELTWSGGKQFWVQMDVDHPIIRRPID
jgi:hypothetical protein